MQVLERYDVTPERAYLASLVAVILGFAGAAVGFTETVWDGFLWRYFWGPVVADAHGAQCAVRMIDSGQTIIDPATGCVGTAGESVLAEPGYTLVSEVGYMAVLIYALVGVYFLLQRLDLEPYREFFYALVPFMLFGGALRTVEDGFDQVRELGFEPALEYPLNSLLISPVIYGTVFVLALAALLVSQWLERADITDTYYYPLGGIGVGLVLATVGYLGLLGLTHEAVEWHPMVLIITIGLSTLIAAAVYTGAQRWAPWINDGTGLMGAIILWGHGIDGVANVIASDWTHLIGLPAYGAKHPVNRIIVDVTVAIQPASLTGAIGSSWPFLVVKIVVVTGIIALFDDEFIQEAPRYAIMLLGAIIAVGLGPGTRDMLRVAFGI